MAKEMFSCFATCPEMRLGLNQLEILQHPSIVAGNNYCSFSGAKKKYKKKTPPIFPTIWANYNNQNSKMWFSKGHVPKMPENHLGLGMGSLPNNKTICYLY